MVVTTLVSELGRQRQTYPSAAPGRSGFSHLLTDGPYSNAESRVWHITGHPVNIFGTNQVNRQKNLLLILMLMMAASIYLAPIVCRHRPTALSN